jgi:hypothetical protein
MNINLNVRTFILAGVLSTATMFSSSPDPDPLVPFSGINEPPRRVYIGTHRSEVTERIGPPSDRFSSDVWVYWNYCDQLRAPNDPYKTLIIVFTGDRVARIRYTDTKATRAALAKFRRDAAIAQLARTLVNPAVPEKKVQ